MGEGTAIEWATDTWNPVIGCQKVSPACANCYAETYAAQRLGRPELWRGERHVTSVSTWGLPERIDRKAGRDRRRARLFVASLSDVFEDHPVWNEPPWLPNNGSVRTRALRKLAKLRNVDVLLLTKRPENILRMVPPEWVQTQWDFEHGWPRHVWVGTTVEDQQRADERIPHLLRVPARVRFLSVEPMLGPVNLSACLFTQPPTGAPDEPAEAGGLWRGPSPLGAAGVQWVIAGGESGPKARPSHPDWFRSLRDQCARAGVPFLFKQWGEWAPVVGLSVTADGQMHRAGKKRAGRLLDGVEHNAFPEVVERVVRQEVTRG